MRGLLVDLGHTCLNPFLSAEKPLWARSVFHPVPCPIQPPATQPSICTYIHTPTILPSIQPPIHTSVYPPIHLSSTMYPSIHPTIHPSVHPSIHPSVYTCIHICTKSYLSGSGADPIRGGRVHRNRNADRNLYRQCLRSFRVALGAWLKAEWELNTSLLTCTQKSLVLVTSGQEPWEACQTVAEDRRAAAGRRDPPQSVFRRQRNTSKKVRGRGVTKTQLRTTHLQPQLENFG